MGLLKEVSRDKKGWMMAYFGTVGQYMLIILVGEINGM